MGTPLPEWAASASAIIGGAMRLAFGLSVWTAIMVRGWQWGERLFRRFSFS
jgi:sulfite exporter TauE/SafE